MSTPALNSEKAIHPSSPCPAYSLPTHHYVPEENNGYDQYIRMIQQVYRTKIKPLEMNYNFEGFYSSPLNAADISAKPMVLLIGQYSTGKTTLIKYLLGKSYPGEHIGVEPTTDRFIAVMHDEQDRIIPGHASVANQELPFRDLGRFGQSFLSKFQVSQTSSPILENMTIIDTPGILAGDKQRVERGYDHTEVIEWFAQRADLVLLMFDSHKLDISNEFQKTIECLRGVEEKVRVVLNKSDMVNPQQLMRVYGAMMWSLGKVVQSPEVIRVFLGTFWSECPPNRFEGCHELIEAESRDLLKDLQNLKRQAIMRKINEMIKRARQAKVHALIIGHLKNEMPSLFGKRSKQVALLAGLDEELSKVQQRHRIPTGDLPNLATFRTALSAYDMDKFKPLRDDLLMNVDEALDIDLPRLVSIIPLIYTALYETDTNTTIHDPSGMLSNATTGTNGIEMSTLSSQQWIIPAADKTIYHDLFASTVAVEGVGNDMLSGTTAKNILMESGLSNDILARIWQLSDMSSDGFLDADEFAVAMHLVKIAKAGVGLPEKLPLSLVPS